MKALVIGGTKGFGKEVSNNLLKNNFNLVTVSRAKRGINSQPHYSCDIINLKLWEKILKKIKKHKKIDLIFFILGFANPKPSNKLTIKDWEEALAKNLIYVSMALEQLKGNLIKSKNPKIITIGSQWSYKVGCDPLVPYTVSKHALKTLTEDFASRNKKIKANHFCLPTMDTPGYRPVKKAFLKIGEKKIISGFSMANPKIIAESLVKFVLKFNKSGNTFVVDITGKINRIPS